MEYYLLGTINGNIVFLMNILIIENQFASIIKYISWYELILKYYGNDIIMYALLNYKQNWI